MSRTLKTVAVIAGAVTLVTVTAGAAAGVLAPGLAGTASVGGMSTGLLSSVASYASLAAPCASIGGELRAMT